MIYPEMCCLREGEEVGVGDFDKVELNRMQFYRGQRFLSGIIESYTNMVHTVFQCS